MLHIDEHTLELYVLGSSGAAARRREIERHLAECHGCRSLVESMRSFYTEAGQALETVDTLKDAPERALVRADQSLRPLYDDIGPVEPVRRSVTPLGRTQVFIRRHPVAAGSGMLASCAAILFGLYALRPSPPLPEPHHALPNFQTGRMEIYDTRDSLLWAIPSHEISLAREGAGGRATEFLKHRVALADLDGDGRNEVLTTLALYGETISESLRVFSADHTTQWSRGFSREIPHKTNRYTEQRFTSGSMAVIGTSGGEAPAIYVVAGISHSPTALVHLDAGGIEQGRYWHHGQFQVHAADLDRDGRKEIIVYGIDDSNEGRNTEFPFVALLDPREIRGEAQSSATPYYRLPLSTAEEYYVALPLSDIHYALEINAGANLLVHENDSLFSITAISTPEWVPSFRFWFNHRLEALQVKSGNPTDQLHERLRREGKITSRMGPEYLEELRRAVRYWDGSAWRDQPTRVHRAPLTASSTSR